MRLVKFQRIVETNVGGHQFYSRDQLFLLAECN